MVGRELVLGIAANDKARVVALTSGVVHFVQQPDRVVVGFVVHYAVQRVEFFLGKVNACIGGYLVPRLYLYAGADTKQGVHFQAV